MIRIGLDLDNCIFDSEPIYKKAFKGTKYTYFLPQRYLITETYPKEVADRLFHLFQCKDTYITKPYDPTLAKYINNLIDIKECEFHVITARKSFNDPLLDTYKQLQKYNFRIPLSNVHITASNKISTITKYSIDYMLDDNPYVIEDCLLSKATPILISNEKTPYNQYLRDKVEWHPDVKTALKLLIYSR